MSIATDRFAPMGLDKDRLAQSIASHGLSGVLLTSPENVYYVTGYTTMPTAGNPILYLLRNRLPFSAFIDATGKTTLFCWLYSTMGVDIGVDEIIGFSDRPSAIAKLVEFLTPLAGSRIGVESTCPYYVIELLSGASTSVADELMLQARAIKTPLEIEHLARSLKAAEATMQDLFGRLKIGMGRIELINSAKSLLFTKGATGIGHATITFGTANPELAINEKLEPEHLITLDIGAVHEGYASDTRRYAYSGNPPRPLLEHYARMVDVVDEVGAAIKPGARYSEVFNRGKSLLTNLMGSPPAWLSHVGHHIGLETEEEWITDREDLEIRPGMVINIELYSQAPTGDYIGNEETFVVEGHGSNRISQLAREVVAV